jgi:hypothetical protein
MMGKCLLLSYSPNPQTPFKVILDTERYKEKQDLTALYILPLLFSTIIILGVIKSFKSEMGYLGMLVHIYNPSYSGGRGRTIEVLG